MTSTETFVNSPRVYVLENLYISFDARLSNIESDVSTLKTDVAELKSDVATLKTDMKEIKTLIVHSNEMNEVRYQDLTWTVGVCFGGIAVIAALLALLGLFKGNGVQHSHNHYSFISRKYIPWLRR